MPVEPTPNEHPNADLVRRAHRAFKTGDMETVHQLFDFEGMVWTVTGHSPAGGTTTGMDGVMRNFGDIMAWTQGTYDAAPVDYLGSDDPVGAPGRGAAHLRRGARGRPGQRAPRGGAGPRARAARRRRHHRRPRGRGVPGARRPAGRPPAHRLRPAGRARLLRGRAPPRA